APRTSDFYPLSLHDALPIFVILQPENAAAELGPAGNVQDLRDQLLARVVARMRLAGKDDLHRPVLVVDDRQQPIDVAEDERAARSEEHTSELQSRFDLVCRL